MRFLSTARALFGVALAVLLAAAPASAQATSGTITGRVIDNQNLAVPGVTVTVEGPNLQGALSAVTSENGDYILPQLPPGTYTVTFTLSGFGRQQRTIAVAPTQTVPLNVTLGVASLDETVNVVGKSADVLTQTAQVATNFQQELIAMLPTNRDINAVLLMAPAVHPSGPGGNFSIAGAMSYESLYLVNGVTVNENLRGQAFNIYIEDAIQETTVATDGVSAEFGRFSGGLVNVITKSGGNLFSGSFRESLFNDNWRSLVSRQRQLRRAGRGRDDADVQYGGLAERRPGRRSWLFRERHQGRQGRADARVRPRRSDPEGPAVVLHRRPVPEPAGVAQHDSAGQPRLSLRRSAEAVRGQDDRLDQFEPPSRRRLREGVAETTEQHL